MINVKDYPLEQKIFTDMWNLFKTYADLGVLGEKGAMDMLHQTAKLSEQYSGTRAQQFYTDMLLAVMEHVNRLNS